MSNKMPDMIAALKTAITLADSEGFEECADDLRAVLAHLERTQPTDTQADLTERARDYVDIVFDGPPAPESGRFVEVENSKGASIKFGEWVHREDGYWVLRIEVVEKK